MYKITFYVPFEKSEDVKIAMFEAGAGKYDHYDHCSWEVQGMGQFRPLEGSNPSIGSCGEIEQVEETRIEMICSDLCIKEVISVLRSLHPYETPAYNVIKLEDF